MVQWKKADYSATYAKSISLILHGISITGHKEVENIVTPKFQSSDKISTSVYLIDPMCWAEAIQGDGTGKVFLLP